MFTFKCGFKCSIPNLVCTIHNNLSPSKKLKETEPYVDFITECYVLFVFVPLIDCLVCTIRKYLVGFVMKYQLITPRSK